ncbi:MAG: hypothetical protein V2I36_16885 [Desulfopila sp.]|nr:hypothetical protein [Desulfopila sp.]
MGYGGQEKRETVILTTNDYSRPELKVMLQGTVEKPLTFSPNPVILQGSAGQKITVDVEIVQHKDASFAITDTHIRHKNLIRAELIQPCVPERKKCILRVENLHHNSGSYADYITFRTSSSLQPFFSLSVIGRIK